MVDSKDQLQVDLAETDKLVHSVEEVEQGLGRENVWGVERLGRVADRARAIFGSRFFLEGRQSVDYSYQAGGPLPLPPVSAASVEFARGNKERLVLLPGCVRHDGDPFNPKENEFYWNDHPADIGRMRYLFSSGRRYPHRYFWDERNPLPDLSGIDYLTTANEDERSKELLAGWYFVGEISREVVLESQLEGWIADYNRGLPEGAAPARPTTATEEILLRVLAILGAEAEPVTIGSSGVLFGADETVATSSMFQGERVVVLRPTESAGHYITFRPKQAIKFRLIRPAS